MKGKFLFAALASVVFASCTNDEQVVEVPKGNEIRLTVATQTASSRAEHDKDVAFTGDLKVWAWVAGETTTIINGDTYNAGNNTFAGNKIYYYPANEKNVDFLVVPVEAIEKGYFTAPTRNADGTTDYKFQVGHTDHTSGQHSTDLMTSEVITQNNGVVGVILRHLTSKLNLRIQQVQKQDDAKTCVVELKNVTLQNIRNHGYVNLNQDWNAVNGGNDCFWSRIESDGLCEWSVYAQTGDTGHLLASHDVEQSNTAFETKTSHFIVPQNLEMTSSLNPQQLYLQYAVHTQYKNNQPSVTEFFEKTLPLHLIESVPNWAMNKNITYIISMNPMEESHKITFDVEVEAWGNVNGEATVTPGKSSSQNSPVQP